MSSESGRIVDENALRGFLGRILGWQQSQAIEHALRSIQLSLTCRVALVLLGETDLVPLALALHRRALGSAPFIVCDRRRGNWPATVRSPGNYTSGVAAFRGGGGRFAVHALRAAP